MQSESTSPSGRDDWGLPGPGLRTPCSLCGHGSVPGQGTEVPQAAPCAKQKLSENFKTLTAEPEAKPGPDDCMDHLRRKLVLVRRGEEWQEVPAAT